MRLFSGGIVSTLAGTAGTAGAADGTGAKATFAAPVGLAVTATGTLYAVTAAIILLSTALGVPAATIAARESGRKDPGFVVIDEVAGQAIALLGAVTHPTWQHVLAALLLFRIFDITKPFPVRQLEKLPEGWGIVFDDLAAGLYAWAGMLLVTHWI